MWWIVSQERKPEVREYESCTRVCKQTCSLPCHWANYLYYVGTIIFIILNRKQICPLLSQMEAISLSFTAVCHLWKRAKNKSCQCFCLEDVQKCKIHCIRILPRQKAVRDHYIYISIHEISIYEIYYKELAHVVMGAEKSQCAVNELETQNTRFSSSCSGPKTGDPGELIL